MTKDTKRTGKPASGKTARHTGRKLRRLERQLAETRAQEARRARKVEQARAEDAPREVASRREKKLTRAQRRAAALEVRIAALQGDVAVGRTGSAESDPVATPVPGEPRAYCLRDRATVVITNPSFVEMRNGRRGVAGTCPDCGARVVRPA